MIKELVYIPFSQLCTGLATIPRARESLATAPGPRQCQPGHPEAQNELFPLHSQRRPARRRPPEVVPVHGGCS